ncbi:uncharacterized protein [Callorhinus ursinus]|uniref:uncharacterized protein isoform X1 n=1 Tax=Callorhinus ursinus TaxID=34884 RepID=UPI003CCFF614
MPTRREAGGSELPAKAQERRLQRRAGLGGWGPAALHPPPLAPAGCCGACRIGPPKPEAGGNRRKVARVRGGAGTIPSPRTRRGSRGSPRCLTSGALPSAPGSGSQATAPSASGAAGKLLLLGCWRQTRGDHGRPQVHGGRCNAEGAWGFRPRSREAGKQPSPYLSGWGDSGRAPFPGVPDRKITTKGGPGKSSGWLQDKEEINKWCYIEENDHESFIHSANICVHDVPGTRQGALCRYRSGMGICDPILANEIGEEGLWKSLDLFKR